MRQYQDMLKHIIHNGIDDADRTGTGTRSVFGYQMRFNLQNGFPLLTTKRIFTRGVVGELLWMLRGETNIKPLQEKDIHIWDEWATEEGNLGSQIYGGAWRSWYASDIEIDQISELIHNLKNNPASRRHIISAWNVEYIPDETLSPQKNVDIGNMALAPCHCLFQFYLRNNVLSCQLYQRSADAFLGVPFNIASYALLTHIIAKEIGAEVGEFIHTFGDLHLYLNHIKKDIVYEQLFRDPKELPILKILADKPFDEYEISDFIFEGYNPHPAIKAPISV